MQAMNVKWFLVLAPILLLGVLVQSYFWVPSYEKQAVGNPGRLRTYIEGSIADAKILNPILNADAASSRITDLVFDGLLDLDENLALRGRLATHWTISEKAYLLARPDYILPDGTRATGKRLVEVISSARSKGALPDLANTLDSVRLLPGHQTDKTFPVIVGDAAGPLRTDVVEVAMRIPDRIEFALNKVDQDLFDRLGGILGSAYYENYDYARNASFLDPAEREKFRSQLPIVLPVTEHNPIILFHLRKGVRFHDGHLFDAGDVKFTFEAIMNPRNISPRTSDYEPIKRVEVVDTHTVRVIYKRLHSPAINAWTIGVLPEHLLNSRMLDVEMEDREMSQVARENFGLRDSRFNRRPIGTGAFRFIEWQGDEFIHLVRNQNYWDLVPEYENYYFRVVPELLTQEVEFKSGAIDTYGVQPHQVARYRRDPKYQAFSSTGFGYSYIGYNNRNPLFADKRVRRALGMAINVDEIITFLLYGEGERITGPYPRQTDWYNAGINPLPYDPARARSLLQEVGWQINKEGWLEKDGAVFEFNLITNNGNSIRSNILAIAQDAWKAIGVKCNTQVFEWAVFLKDFVNTGSFDAVVLGWSMGIDPDLYQLFHSSQAGPQQLNFVGYNNPDVDRLIVRLRKEYDHDEQRELTHRLHEEIAIDQPYTFLYVGLATRVLDKKIVLVSKENDGGEKYEKIYPTRSGNLSFYFNRWRKLEFTPDF